MSLAAFSVRRPVLTTMVALIVVILGGVALSRLQVDMLPSVELPRLTVQTEYEGASPEVMERLITQIMEEIIATAPNVEEITSQSSHGRSRIRVTFAWGTDLDTAALDVQGKIEDEINELPEDVVRPRVRKFDVASFPVVLLGIKSGLDPVELTETIETEIRQRFAGVPGVAQVDVWGGYPREVRVEVDADRLKGLRLPLGDVLEALRNANLDLPAGKIERGQHEVTLRAPAEFASLDEIRDTVIAQRPDGAVRLGQIARVKDTYEKETRIIRVNQGRGVRLAIRKEANANTVEVSRGILEQIEATNRAYPQLEIVPVINQGNFIERSIKNVALSVLYGGALAVVILLFFLRSLRSTIVISLSIPISVIATFAFIYGGGLTLNLMTLGGLALGVGMMVDSSIVVLENIFRHRSELGESPEVAAVEGTGEVAQAIVASTITTLVIFLPLVFVRGVSGLLFKELAYVIIFSLVASLLVSLSLVPLLASRLLATPAEGEGEGVLYRVSERFFGWLNATYTDNLRWVLRHRLIAIAVAALLLGGSLFLVPLIGTEFLPPSDEGEVRVTGKMDVGTRLDVVDRQSKLMEELVYPAVPETVSSVITVRTSLGRQGAASQGEIRLSLLPAAQRARSNTEIAQDLRKRLAGRIPGMSVRTRAPQGQFLLERILGNEDGLSVEVRGHDLDTVSALVDKVAEGVSKIEGVTDVESTRESGVPEVKVRVDREKLADLGLSVRDATELLETAMAGSKAGEFRSEGNSYRILVQLRDAEKLPLSEILDLPLTSRDGEQVALRNLVTLDEGRGPLMIDRKDQQRIASLRINVAGRDMGSVAREVQTVLEGVPRPRGYTLQVAGTYEEQQESFRELMTALVLSLVLVYLVLAAQYESFRNPLVVMLSVPVAAVGVLLTLFLTRTTLNVQSGIGCIMLGGIVVNNAILLVDQASQLRASGSSVIEAVVEAGRRRLRPILMTTLTTILGLLPLALGVGEGADAQAPLARAVAGGLAGSTLITLALIPAVYSLLERDAPPSEGAPAPMEADGSV